MSESGDWEPGPWTGHDFKSAKQQYDIHVGRSYSEALSTNKAPEELILTSVFTESKAPLVVACDVTGSMGESPATIFSKCPYLDLEGKEYLGEDMAICFAAIGDAYTDTYPLQIRPFVRGLELKTQLEELIIEGNGGGQTRESYDLAALYFSQHANLPNAIHPIFIFIGDEGLYDFVNPEQAARWAKTEVQQRMSYQDVLAALKQKFSVYIIRQPYSKTGTDEMSDADKVIHAQWAAALGEDHIAFLPDAARVVDVIFGILAKETGKLDYFHNEISQRQTPEQVSVALKGLSSIHTPITPATSQQAPSGKSIITAIITEDASTEASSDPAIVTDKKSTKKTKKSKQSKKKSKPLL